MQFNNESGATAGRWPRTDYMTSSQVTKTFMSITPHRIEVELWARCPCVCLVRAHRLICSRIYLSHSSGHLTRPKVKFQIDLLRSKCICFDAFSQEGYDGAKRFSLSLLFQKLFAQTLIFRKGSIVCLTCPGKVKMWPKVVKSGVAIFRTSRTFRLFLLRSSISTRGKRDEGAPSPPPGAV